jgi:hypothetical protein
LRDGNSLDLMPQLTDDHGLRGVALSGYGMAERSSGTRQADIVRALDEFDQFRKTRSRAFWRVCQN